MNDCDTFFLQLYVQSLPVPSKNCIVVNVEYAKDRILDAPEVQEAAAELFGVSVDMLKPERAPEAAYYTRMGEIICEQQAEAIEGRDFYSILDVVTVVPIIPKFLAVQFP